MLSVDKRSCLPYPTTTTPAVAKCPVGQFLVPNPSILPPTTDTGFCQGCLTDTEICQECQPYKPTLCQKCQPLNILTPQGDSCLRSCEDCSLVLVKYNAEEQQETCDVSGGKCFTVKFFTPNKIVSISDLNIFDGPLKFLQFNDTDNVSGVFDSIKGVPTLKVYPVG